MWGSIIGAGISAAGSLFSSWQNNRNANKMAGNAVQTRVADMRAAGLNPVLAAQNQGAAAVPTQQAADFSSAGEIYAQRTARKAQENQEHNLTRQTDSNLMLQAQQAESSAADVRVKDAQAKNLDVQNNLINEQVLTEAARRANFAANTGLASAQSVRTQYQSMQDKVISDYLHTPVGKESARVNMDASRGGTVGMANTFLRSLQRDYPSLIPSSAKGVQKYEQRLKPNKYQQQMIDNYKR